jgi:hypothetical protein
MKKISILVVTIFGIFLGGVDGWASSSDIETWCVKYVKRSVNLSHLADQCINKGTRSPSKKEFRCGLSMVSEFGDVVQVLSSKNKLAIISENTTLNLTVIYDDREGYIEAVKDALQELQFDLLVKSSCP